MSFTRLVSKLKGWVAPVAITALGLSGIAAIPNVYDAARADPFESLYAANDTTYADGHFVILKTAQCTPSGCFYDTGNFPDEFLVTWKRPDFSQLLLHTYEYGHGDALDSAAVDSIWNAWGYLNPQAYALAVPGAPEPLDSLYACTTCTIGDTSTAVSYFFADFYDNTTDLHNDVGDWIYSASWNGDTTKAVLSTRTAYLGVNKSVQYNYIYDTYVCDTNEGSGCDAQTRGTSLHNDIDNKPTVTTPYTEVWWEWSFKLSDNAMGCSYDESWGAANLPMTPGVVPDTTGWINYDPPCAWKFQEFNFTSEGGNYGRHMWILYGGTAAPDGNDIFELHWNYGGADACATPGDSGLAWINAANGPPSNNIADDLPCDPGFRMQIASYVHDGRWHRARMYMKKSTDLATWDGRYAFWLDDSLWVDNVRDSFILRTDTLGYPTRMRVGANKDHGGVFPHNERMNWSHAIVWVDTPSWFLAPDPKWVLNLDTFVNNADYWANAESYWPGYHLLTDSIFSDPNDSQEVRNYLDGSKTYNGNHTLRVEYEGHNNPDTCLFEQGSASAIEWLGAFWSNIGMRESDKFYAEFTLAYDSLWETNPHTTCDPYGNGHKMFRLVTDNGNFAFKDGVFESNIWSNTIPNNSAGVGYNEAVTSTPDSFWVKNGGQQWFKIRLGGTRSSVKGANDGMAWTTIDSAGTWIPMVGDWLDSVTNGTGCCFDLWWDSLAPSGNAARIPMNRNLAAYYTQGLWIADIKFYDEFPGWEGHPNPYR